MKYLNFYNTTVQVRNEKEFLSLFMETVKPGNMLWNYFINWNKVFENVSAIEMELNTLNYLIGRKDFNTSFRKLIKKNPDVIRVLPALAVRAGDGLTEFDILIDYNKGKLTFKKYDFSEYNPKKINEYIEFLKGVGVKKLLQDKKIKNLVDYMIGVEAGLDSNARKNRAGSAMEEIVEIFIKDFCKKKHYQYQKEVTAKGIKEKFGYEIPFNKQDRRYDFFVDTGKEPIIFEVNFYNSKGGSKLKATAGEYIGLHSQLKKKGIQFIWITDGPGWLSVQAGLSEALKKIDYIFNLHLLEKGVLIKEF